MSFRVIVRCDIIISVKINIIWNRKNWMINVWGLISLLVLKYLIYTFIELLKVEISRSILNFRFTLYVYLLWYFILFKIILLRFGSPNLMFTKLDKWSQYEDYFHFELSKYMCFLQHCKALIFISFSCSVFFMAKSQLNYCVNITVRFRFY